MGEFEYLPGVLSYATALYIVLLLIFIILYRSKCFTRNPCLAHDKWTYCSTFFKGKSFEYVYHSTWTSKLGAYLLLLLRFSFFCYFFGIAFLRSYIINDGDAIYFTFWNIDLLSLYYFLALIASIIGICYDPGAPNHYKHYWLPRTMQFGYCVQIVYEVIVPSSWFVTVIAYTLLNPHFAFQNITIHFVTSISLVFELLLNRFSVRLEHIIFYLTWIYCYLLFVWPLVASGGVTHWPYYFLDTDTRSVYLWYTLLIFVSLGFYVLFWLVVSMKNAVLERCCNVPNTVRRGTVSHYPMAQATATAPPLPTYIIPNSHDSSNSNNSAKTASVSVPAAPVVSSTAPPAFPVLSFPRRQKTYYVTTKKAKSSKSSIFAEEDDL